VLGTIESWAKNPQFLLDLRHCSGPAEIGRSGGADSSTLEKDGVEVILVLQQKDPRAATNDPFPFTQHLQEIFICVLEANVSENSNTDEASNELQDLPITGSADFSATAVAGALAPRRSVSRFNVFQKNSIVREGVSTVARRRELMVRAKLGKKVFVVVPSTWNVGVQAQFSVAIFVAASGAKFQALDEDIVLS